MSILKKIKKLLRRYKGFLALGTILTIILAGVFFDLGGKEQEQAIDVMGNYPVQLILETKYLCGTEIEIKEYENKQDLEVWLQDGENDWVVTEEKDGQYRLVRQIDNELSPLCKNEGYFGISDDGKLTIFQGPPSEQQVIETFFRIDTDLLEVKLPKNEVDLLHQGIRVQNVSEYLSILSTYGEFATEY